MLADLLQTIVENSPGAKGAILMGFDGIAVMQHVAAGYEDTDIESLAMEYSFRFIDLRKAAEALDMGDMTDITIKAERGTVIVRVLSEEYFVALLLGQAGHFGKSRWMLRSNAQALSSQLT